MNDDIESERESGQIEISSLKHNIMCGITKIILYVFSNASSRTTQRMCKFKSNLVYNVHDPLYSIVHFIRNCLNYDSGARRRKFMNRIEGQIVIAECLYTFIKST